MFRNSENKCAVINTELRYKLHLCMIKKYLYYVRKGKGTSLWLTIKDVLF